jgi:hypothetical protein
MGIIFKFVLNSNDHGDDGTVTTPLLYLANATEHDNNSEITTFLYILEIVKVKQRTTAWNDDNHKWWSLLRSWCHWWALVAFEVTNDIKWPSYGARLSVQLVPHLRPQATTTRLLRLLPVGFIPRHYALYTNHIIDVGVIDRETLSVLRYGLVVWNKCAVNTRTLCFGVWCARGQDVASRRLVRRDGKRISKKQNKAKTKHLLQVQIQCSYK